MNPNENPMADIFNGEKNRTFSENFIRDQPFNDDKFEV
jgi:hypothetical protein